MSCRGFRNSVVIAILIALLVKDTTAVSLMQKALFIKGRGGYNNYRIPALLTTQAGGLILNAVFTVVTTAIGSG